MEVVAVAAHAAPKADFKFSLRKSSFGGDETENTFMVKETWLPFEVLWLGEGSGSLWSAVWKW